MKVYTRVIFTGLLPLCAAGVTVEVDLNTGREAGGVTTFDRSKFITIHSSHTDSDWDGGQQGAPNALPDLLDDFMNGRDVYFGRDTGGISWQRRGNAYVKEDASKPGWVDGSTLVSEGLKSRNSYDSDTDVHAYEFRARTDIMCAQYSGFWPNGNVYNDWAISTNDSPSEPLGSATGDFIGRYLDNYYDNFGENPNGRPSPAYVEIINEPDWHLLDWTSDPDYGSATAEDLWRFHNGVADGIRAHNTNSLIGGFVTTFPDHDEDDFQEWEDEWKSFIDIAGAKMDFWSLHLYDFPSIGGGQRKYRKGANMEAMFDMIDYYSEKQLGVRRPYVISEYGAQTHDYNNQGWNAYRDWLRLKSCNAMMLAFMDRPHMMLKTVPFTVVKAEWGRNSSTGEPYGPRLMRQENEPESYTGDWIYTDLVKFYDQWANVKGARLDVTSDDPDIQVDAYADDEKVYLIINNLVDEISTVDLSLFDTYSNTVQSVLEKNLYWDGVGDVGSVALIETNHVGGIAQVQVGREGCVILEYTLSSPVQIEQTLSESKYYADSYLKVIHAGLTNSFHINSVTLGQSGRAELRIGFARAYGLSQQPSVKVNGVSVAVPGDLMGFEEDDRFQYFGMLHVPVDHAQLQENNTVDVVFPDSGGHISTVALRVIDDGQTVPPYIDIDYYEMLGTSIVLGFTNGPSDSYFALLSKTNLTDLTWFTNQTDLPSDAAGAGAVTNPAVYPQEFFRLMETDAPDIPIAGNIEFTAPDYMDGPLDGQQFWNAESGWSVADAEGSGRIETGSGGQAAVLDEPVQLTAGESYSLRILLEFTGSYSTPTNYVYAFLGGLKDSSAGESVGTGDTVAADANIQILEDQDTYRLLSNYATVSGASNIAGAPLNAGDLLQFDYVLTMGVDAASTVYTVRLQNLTDGTDTGAGTVSGVDAALYSALNGGGAYGFFQTINPGANNSGLNGVWVHSVMCTITP
ncbi:hypothetical protein EGM51_00205 [Verrucomicrobia bacterium S94]|nr:hypothetical protein EGM51_00205 [Verrucomicrobia bacterium S94]